MDDYLLGIDIGSGGCKVTLFNIERNASITRNEECPTYYPRAGWAEQNAEDWVIETGKLIKLVLEEENIPSTAIVAVGVGGVTHSPVLLDKNRKVLGRVIHITDARSAKQAEGLRNRAHELMLSIGLNAVSVIWTIAMLQWLKESEPERWSRISKILFPKDYVRFRLTGTEVTDHIDAQGSLLYNPLKKKWDERLISLVSLNKEFLPEVVEPEVIAGEVTEEGAEWSGLEKGTKVIAGTTDTALEVFAAGSNRPGDTTVKLATFGRICVIADRPLPDEKLITYSYIKPGLWYPGTGTKSFASSLRWFRDQFCRELDSISAYGVIDEEVEKVKPGSDGIIFHPYLQGEGSPYNDPYLRGDFIGLTMHHKREHLIRAVMEGAAFSLLDSIGYIEQKGIRIEPPLRFIGGGTRSKVWPKIVSDILGEDGVIPIATDPSFGAALLAGIGLGVFSSVEEAQGIQKGYSKIVEHNKENSKIYRDLFELYKKGHDVLVDIHHRLSESFQ